MSVLQSRFEVPVAAGVKAYAEIDVSGSISITAKAAGRLFNTYTVEMTDSVSKGDETINWGPNAVLIEIESGASTITDVLAALGGVTGTPWADLAAIAAGATTVAALVATPMADLPDAVLGVDGSGSLVVDLDTISDMAKTSSVLMVRNEDNKACEVEVQDSATNFVGVKPSGDKSGIKVTGKLEGDSQEGYTVTIANTVLKGAEKLTWAAGTLVIAVQSGVSTVADVLAAGGGVVGTPWGDVSAYGALTDTVAAIGATAISALNHFVAGEMGGAFKTNESVVGTSYYKPIVLSGLQRYIKVLPNGPSSKLEVVLICQ